MEITTVATLAIFAAAAIGGIIGTFIGWLTRFETGLGAGLLVLGAVCLWYSGRCLLEYQTFLHAGTNAAWGEVIAVEDEPVGASGTQQVPIVRFGAPDETTHTVRGPRASGFKVGDALSVIYDAASPERSRVGKLSQFRGCAIAMLLFGTFPFSFGLWFSFLAPRSSGSVEAKHARPARIMAGLDRAILLVLFLALLLSILWIGIGPHAPERGFVEGFAAVGCTLIAYAIWGAMRASLDASWSLGVAILGVNFGGWAFALYLLL